MGLGCFRHVIIAVFIFAFALTRAAEKPRRGSSVALFVCSWLSFLTLFLFFLFTLYIYYYFSSSFYCPLQFNSQSSSLSPQLGLGPGIQSPASVAAVTSSSLQNTVHQQGQHALLSGGPKDAGTSIWTHKTSCLPTLSSIFGFLQFLFYLRTYILLNSLYMTFFLCYFCDSDAAHVKVEDQQQHQNPSDDLKTEPATNSGLSKNLMNDNDLKIPYAVDAPVCWKLLACFLFKGC